MAWKRADDGNSLTGWQVKRERGYFHDFDISGDELILLGFPDVPTYERQSLGGYVWRADLSKGLDQWEVVHESKEVANNHDLFFSEAALGSARFLRRGGVIVAPSFLPGLLLLSGAGAVKRRWTSEDLWGSTAGWRDGPVTAANFTRFLAAAKTVDLVLALPDGPAVLMREPRGRGASYRLGVLGPEIEWYDVPIDTSPVAQLRGDADGAGRIVLAGVRRNGLPSARVTRTEVVVLRLPMD